MSAAAAAAKAHQEKRSAELKKFEAELRDRTKELDKQANKVGRKAHCHCKLLGQCSTDHLSIASSY